MVLKQLLKNIDLKVLAIPSNITYGAAIFKRGAVEVISQNSQQVEAWVGGLDGRVKEGGGGRRRVRLMSSGGKLSWHCTGNPKDHDIFCKHCIAVALFLQND